MTQHLTLDFFVGEHTLDFVPLTDLVRDKKDDWSEAANGCAFCLDGIAVAVWEDPSDGYRSTAEHPEPFTGLFKEPFNRRVLCSMGSSSGEEGVLHMRDLATGQIIFEVGTANHDDYYPSYQCRWIPLPPGTPTPVSVV